MTTFPRGYVELMVSVGEESGLKSISTKFLVIPCKSLYNHILGRPFTTVLDVVTSPMHLKLKYHNLHKELVVLCTYLDMAKKIHHALQKDHGNNMTMEINMISLNYQLKNMNLHTSQRG